MFNISHNGKTPRELLASVPTRPPCYHAQRRASGFTGDNGDWISFWLIRRRGSGQYQVRVRRLLSADHIGGFAWVMPCDFPPVVHTSYAVSRRRIRGNKNWQFPAFLLFSENQEPVLGRSTPSLDPNICEMAIVFIYPPYPDPLPLLYGPIAGGWVALEPVQLAPQRQDATEQGR